MSMVRCMNRKQALKSMKKDKKSRNVESDTNYLNRFVMTVAFLLVALIIGYLFIGIFVTKTIFNDKEEEKQEVTINNEYILAGQIFDQKEDAYYVLVYNKQEKNQFIDSWKGKYSGNSDALPIYIVDISNAMNNAYIVEKDSNTHPTGYDDLKIVSPTLMKIENKTVVEYIEGSENIENAFKQ